ncbi:MAG: type II secretion system protein [Bdellovibrionota bacterium]
MRIPVEGRDRASRGPVPSASAEYANPPSSGVSDAHGFTLLEVLVALGILVTMISVASSMFMFNLRNNMRTQLQYEAIQAAQAVLDELRLVDVKTLTGTKNEDITIGKRTYAVAVRYCELDEYCLSDDIKHITVAVTYNDQQIYETDTVFSKF